MRNGGHGAMGLKRLAELWLLMMRRRWTYESSVAVSAIAFAGFLVLLGRTAKSIDPSIITLIFGVAVCNAVNLTLTTGGSSLATTTRLQLLPLGRRVRFASRVLFGTPLRLPAFLFVWIWSGVMIGASGLSIGRSAAEALQATLLVVAAAMLSVIWAEPVLSRWSRTIRTAFVATTFGLTLGVLVPRWHPTLSDRLPMTLRDVLSALEIGGRAPILWELFGVAVYGGLAAAFVIAAFRVSAAPPARPVDGRARMSPLSRALGVLAPPLRKEMLLLLRMVGVRPAITLTLGVCLLSFGVGMPWFLLGAPLFWFGFYLNALGADLPHGGMTRYRLLSMPLRRVLAWRQLAVLLLAGVCALLGAVTIAVTAGIALPVNGGSRWTYAAVLAYALATLGFSAIPASRVAVRYPLPRKRRAWAAAGEAAGPAAMVYWVMIAAVAVVVVDVSAFVAGGMVMRRVAPQLPATPWTAVVAAAIVAAISILATVKGWHAPEGSSV
ncbi:MAG TPA: hypothetical protein VIF32_10140 [Gemmatimonadaceae bacterium]|jgi:hypothetical protein